MALVKCTECGGDVSSEAAACPKCGAKPPKGTSTATIVVGGFFALIVGSCVINGSKETAAPAKTPAQVEAEANKEKQFRTVVAGAKWLKSSMKNPASFELTSAIMMGDEAICYEYRATNSFNAIVPGHRVITNGVNSGETKDWNKYCAGKSGTDFTYARRAL